MADPVAQYLARHAEVEAHGGASPPRRFTHCVIVPAYDEQPGFLARMNAVQHEDVLVIVVVNAPDDAGPGARARTLGLLAALRSSPATNVLLVDRVTRPLPRRQAVGLARKIGSDIALRLHAQGRVASPWLRQTDADAVLPDNYFSVPLADSGAIVFAHQHVAELPLLQHAADLYDLHMRYYVAGLEFAGSYYAYPTLGSTIAIHANAYAAVRGFPKRNAAEDFYLLNKVAKVGATPGASSQIHRVDATIKLAARMSPRVPFGTGPALARIVALLQHEPSGETYASYDWASFRLLKSALRDLDAFSEADANTLTVREITRSDPTADVLTAIGFDKVAQKMLAKYSPGPRRRRAIRDWFDGFKTLRFVHEARRYHADTPLLASARALPDPLRNALHIPTIS